MDTHPHWLIEQLTWIGIERKPQTSIHTTRASSAVAHDRSTPVTRMDY